MKSPLLLLVLLVVGGTFFLPLLSDEVTMHGFKIVNTYPHDKGAFTQGLIFTNGALYESTGQHGESTVRKVKLETGEVEKKLDLNLRFFGEGLTRAGDELIQLTWRSGTARVYKADTLEHIEDRKYSGEGWGLTYDGKSLIQSDGTQVLRFRNPKTLAEERRITVRIEDGRSVSQLNELEWVDGEIWANIWKVDRIVRIDPKDGRVKGWIDLAGLFDYRKLGDPEAVLNGIAYDEKKKRIFVTGKRWPKLFEIELVEKEG